MLYVHPTWHCLVSIPLGKCNVDGLFARMLLLIEEEKERPQNLLLVLRTPCSQTSDVVSQALFSLERMFGERNQG
jgi:hypothetical protein